MIPPHPPSGPPLPPGAADGMQDEDVLRFAPPEIRRLWKRVVSVESQLQDIREALRRIEQHLTGKSEGA